MSSQVSPRTPAVPGAGIPIIAVDIPVLYEDEGQEEMGESTPHTVADRILLTALLAHFAGRPVFQVLSNLNLHYHPIDRAAYVSPDEMVVELPRPLENVGSYVVGRDGPAPLLTIEVLSKRSFQQQDLSNKPLIYATLGVPEYVLVDTTGNFLPEKLLLKRLNVDGSWTDERDLDGGITSRLGFRIRLDLDGQVRVLDSVTGRHYLRPAEVEAARIQLERQVQHEKQRADLAEQRLAEESAARADLEAELRRLRRPAGEAT